MKKLLLIFTLSLTLFAFEGKLAVQWFSSVCKVHHYKACRDPLNFWKEHFTLHGLWPKNKEYCVPPRLKILDKKRAWKKIRLPLADPVKKLLALYMPGAISGLHAHEWVKHGSCMAEPNSYFNIAISYLQELDESPIRLFFLENRGKLVQGEKIRKIFDRAFGRGAGKRVKIICQKGYITELRLNLKGELEWSLQRLLHHAKKSPLGCKLGKIGR